MADIRQYRKEKENMEKEHDEDYETRLRAHRIKLTRMVIIITAVVILAILIFSLVKNKSNYTGYKVESQLRREESGHTEYISFGGKIVRCSKDGIAAFSYQGEPLWNSTYEVNNIAVDYSGSYLAVADLKGNKIYTFNSNGYITDINTTLPILQISVSKAGYVAAVLEDKNADYINMYTMAGEKAYTIKKTIGLDGVPLSISVSDDREKLVAAFTGVKGNSFKTSVVFYNFNEVGQNENERVVGGYDYGETLVGKVEFINSTTVVAYAEDKISVYRIKEYPELVKEIAIDYNIEHIFSGNSYFGVVHRDDDTDKNILEIYNTSGNLVYSDKFDRSFTGYKFSGDNILIYGENECILSTLKGRIKYKNTFENGISNIIPINGKDEFIYINRDYVEKIKLK